MLYFWQLGQWCVVLLANRTLFALIDKNWAFSAGDRDLYYFEQNSSEIASNVVREAYKTGVRLMQELRVKR